jgi:hypothetical protein
MADLTVQKRDSSDREIVRLSWLRLRAIRRGEQGGGSPPGKAGMSSDEQEPTGEPDEDPHPEEGIPALKSLASPNLPRHNAAGRDAGVRPANHPFWILSLA